MTWYTGQPSQKGPRSSHVFLSFVSRKNAPLRVPISSSVRGIELAPPGRNPLAYLSDRRRGGKSSVGLGDDPGARPGPSGRRAADPVSERSRGRARAAVVASGL